MKIIRLIIYSFAVLILLPTYLYAAEAGIEVTGTARESVVPDKATFSFAINGRGKQLANLKAEVDQKTAATVSLCKRLGIKSKNITSSEVSIHPQYNYQTKSFLGYDVLRNLKVVLEDLNQYAPLVNGAIKAGITNISSIRLDTKNRDVLEKKALAAAVAVAKSKALEIASSSGVKLGNVIAVKEMGGPIRVESYAFRQKAAPAGVAQGAFEPGQITVTATVSVRYAIK